MKHIVTIIISLLVLFILSTFSYSGTLDKCTVLRTGTAPDFINTTLKRSAHVVWVTHSSWPGSRVFFLSSDAGDAGLAVLLTAISTSKTVYMGFETASSVPEAGTIVDRVYLNSY